MSDFFLRTKRTSEISAERPDATEEYIWGEGTNDLVANEITGFRVVSGTEKLVQDIIKILLTERGSNTLTPLYGSNLHQLISQKADLDVLHGQIISEIKDSLLILQSINKNNPNLDEQVKTLESVSVDQPTPTQFNVRFTVITMADKRVGAILNLVV